MKTSRPEVVRLHKDQQQAAFSNGEVSSRKTTESFRYLRGINWRTRGESDKQQQKQSYSSPIFEMGEGIFTVENLHKPGANFRNAKKPTTYTARKTFVELLMKAFRSFDWYKWAITTTYCNYTGSSLKLLLFCAMLIRSQLI